MILITGNSYLNSYLKLHLVLFYQGTNNNFFINKNYTGYYKCQGYIIFIILSNIIFQKFAYWVLYLIKHYLLPKLSSRSCLF